MKPEPELIVDIRAWANNQLETHETEWAPLLQKDTGEFDYIVNRAFEEGALCAVSDIAHILGDVEMEARAEKLITQYREAGY